MISYKSLLILPALVAPAVSEYSTFECRPLEDESTNVKTNCGGTHPSGGDCSGTVSCCPLGVTADWRDGNPACTSAGNLADLDFKDLFKETETYDDLDAVDVGEPVAEEEDSASLRAGSTMLLASSLFATAILGLN